MKNGSDIQIENGEFSRIHNDILSALAVARFTGSEYRCLLFLLRKTYGWLKKEDDISLSQWAEGTGTDKRQNVLRTLQGLTKKGVIYSIDNGQNRTQTWGFNKYVEQWDSDLFAQTVIPQDNSSVMPQDNSLGAGVISQDNTSVIPQDNRTVISQDNNKRNIKEKKEISSSSTDEAAPAETTPTDSVGKKERKPKTTRKSKEDSAAEPKETPEQQQWFKALFWLVYGHEDFSLLANGKKAGIGKVASELRNNGYTLEELKRWYAGIWSKEWPGLQRDGTHQRPTLVQVKEGLPRVRVSSNGNGGNSTSMSRRVQVLT